MAINYNAMYHLKGRGRAGSPPPYNPPGALLLFDVSPGNGQATASWTYGTDGGTPIIGVKLYQGTSPGSLSLIATITNNVPYTITGLTNGTTYYFAARAYNIIGDGPLSATDSAQPSAAILEAKSLMMGMNVGFNRYSFQLDHVHDLFNCSYWYVKGGSVRQRYRGFNWSADPVNGIGDNKAVNSSSDGAVYTNSETGLQLGTLKIDFDGTIYPVNTLGTGFTTYPTYNLSLPRYLEPAKTQRTYLLQFIDKATGNPATTPVSVSHNGTMGFAADPQGRPSSFLVTYDVDYETDTQFDVVASSIPSTGVKPRILPCDASGNYDASKMNRWMNETEAARYANVCHILRIMNWRQINNILGPGGDDFNFGEKDATMLDTFGSENISIKNHSKVANEIGCGMWIQFSQWENLDFIAAAAPYLAQINSPNNVLEISNEPWNSGFENGTWMQLQGIRAGYGATGQTGPTTPTALVPVSVKYIGNSLYTAMPAGKSVSAGQMFFTGISGLGTVVYKANVDLASGYPLPSYVAGSTYTTPSFSSASAPVHESRFFSGIGNGAFLMQTVAGAVKRPYIAWPSGSSTFVFTAGDNVYDTDNVLYVRNSNAPGTVGIRPSTDTSHTYWDVATTANSNWVEPSATNGAPFYQVYNVAQTLAAGWKWRAQRYIDAYEILRPYFAAAGKPMPKVLLNHQTTSSTTLSNELTTILNWGDTGFEFWRYYDGSAFAAYMGAAYNTAVPDRVGVTVNNANVWQNFKSSQRRGGADIAFNAAAKLALYNPDTPADTAINTFVDLAFGDESIHQMVDCAIGGMYNHWQAVLAYYAARPTWDAYRVANNKQLYPNCYEFGWAGRFADFPDAGGKNGGTAVSWNNTTTYQLGAYCKRTISGTAQLCVCVVSGGIVGDAHDPAVDTTSWKVVSRSFNSYPSTGQYRGVEATYILMGHHPGMGTIISDFAARAKAKFGGGIFCAFDSLYELDLPIAANKQRWAMREKSDGTDAYGWAGCATAKALFDA